MRRFLWLPVVVVIFLAFQNQVVVRFFQYKAQNVIVNPVSRISINGKIRYNHVSDNSTRGAIGESSAQGAGAVPSVVFTRDLEKSYVAFAINHDADYIRSYDEKKRVYALENPETETPYQTSDRSEIRLLNSDTDFTESSPPQTSYSSFKFFIPNETDPIPLGDWSLIWQCGQHDEVSRTPGRSPPLSLHIEGARLSMVTYENFTTTGVNPENQRIRRHSQDLAPITKGRWYHVIMRYTLGRNGSYAVWLDGTQIRFPASHRPNNPAQAKYLPIGYTDGVYQGKRACRVSYGLYKKDVPGNYKILFQGINFGERYQSFR